MRNKLITPITLTFMFVLGFLSANVFTIWAHGGDSELIHACVKDANGDIRIVGANETCKNNESPLDWRIQGEPGPSGEGELSEHHQVIEFTLAPGESRFIDLPRTHLPITVVVAVINGNNPRVLRAGHMLVDPTTGLAIYEDNFVNGDYLYLELSETPPGAIGTNNYETALTYVISFWY